MARTRDEDKPPTGHANDNYTPEELEFLKAVQQYKKVHNRPYPTWREVLWLVKRLGYRKVETPAPTERESQSA